MDFEGRNIISAKDFSREEFLYVAALASKFKHTKTGFVGSGINYRNFLNGKIVALLFLQPSTRTRGSFEFAVKSLGGNVVHYSYSGSSMEKGETLEDTLAVISGTGYDAVIMRHSDANSIKSALNYCRIPVINAGNSNDEHPTQSFLDICTLIEEMAKRKKRGIDGLKVGIFGDLKNGRAAHSLAYALSNFDVALYLVSSENFRMPAEILNELNRRNVKFTEESIRDLPSLIKELDVGYAMRRQLEYANDNEKEELLNDYFSIGREILSYAKPNFILMHPLPRGDEIAAEVDNNEKAVYFEQAANGTPVRQALLSLVLGAVK